MTEDENQNINPFKRELKFDSCTFNNCVFNVSSTNNKENVN